MCLTERTTTLDIDILDPDAAQYVEDLVRDMFGEVGTVLVRFGSPPKRAIPLRTAKPFARSFTASETLTAGSTRSRCWVRGNR